MHIKKESKFNIKKYHTVFFEIGLIVSLLIFIVAMKADLPGKKSETVDFTDEDEVTIVDHIRPTDQKTNQQPAPPDPDVLPDEPSDVPIEDLPEIDDLDTDPITTDLLTLPEENREEPAEEIFRAVEHEPEIIGGQKALYDKLSYPSKCKRAGIDGRVILEFVVNTDGSVQDVKVARGIGGGCDEAAVNALKEVQFKPGRQRGKPVRVRFYWPIIFELK